MNNKVWALGALAAAAAMAVAVAFSSGASAQTPTPTPAQAPGTGRGYGMGMMAQGRIGGQSNSLVAVSAQALGMSQVDLVASLNGGKTIADVAQEKSVALDKIVDAFVAPREQMLQSAVSAGRLTQAQADANLATMKANVTGQLSAKFTPRGGGAGMGFVDSNGDGVCDNMGTHSQAGTARGPQNRGGRWGK